MFSDSQLYPSRPPSWKRLLRLFASGLVATLGTVVLASSLHLLDFSCPDFASTYGAVLTGQVAPIAFDSLWIVGLAWHLFNGTVLYALLFDAFVRSAKFPGFKGLKGVAFGTGVWFFMELFVHPAAGEGVFSWRTHTPATNVLCAWMLWIFYGVVLECFAAVPEIVEMKMETRSAA